MDFLKKILNTYEIISILIMLVLLFLSRLLIEFFNFIIYNKHKDIDIDKATDIYTDEKIENKEKNQEYNLEDKKKFMVNRD